MCSLAEDARTEGDRTHAHLPLECSEKCSPPSKAALVRDRVRRKICLKQQSLREFDLSAPQILARRFADNA